MSMSKITLLGMVKYLNEINVDLFSGVTLPTGIDKNILCNTILRNGGEFEVIYSDPLFFYHQIPFWCDKWYRTMDKWITALNISYEPLYNYNRFEELEDNTKKTKEFEENTLFNGSIMKIGGATDTNDLTRTDALKRTDNLKMEIDQTIENTRSAMDSSTYQPYNKEETDNTTKNTGTVDNTGTVKNTGSVTHTDNERTGTLNTEGHSSDEEVNEKFTHGAHLYGNIGVTTSQEMLKQELDIVKWNIYDHISDLFLREFCIPIYE